MGPYLEWLKTQKQGANATLPPITIQPKDTLQKPVWPPPAPTAQSNIPLDTANAPVPPTIPPLDKSAYPITIQNINKTAADAAKSDMSSLPSGEGVSASMNRELWFVTNTGEMERDINNAQKVNQNMYEQWTQSKDKINEIENSNYEINPWTGGATDDKGGMRQILNVADPNYISPNVEPRYEKTQIGVSRSESRTPPSYNAPPGPTPPTPPLKMHVLSGAGGWRDIKTGINSIIGDWLNHAYKSGTNASTSAGEFFTNGKVFTVPLTQGVYPVRPNNSQYTKGVMKMTGNANDFATLLNNSYAWMGNVSKNVYTVDVGNPDASARIKNGTMQGMFQKMDRSGIFASNPNRAKELMKEIVTMSAVLNIERDAAGKVSYMDGLYEDQNGKLYVSPNKTNEYNRLLYAAGELIDIMNGGYFSNMSNVDQAYFGGATPYTPQQVREAVYYELGAGFFAISNHLTHTNRIKAGPGKVP